MFWSNCPQWKKTLFPNKSSFWTEILQVGCHILRNFIRKYLQNLAGWYFNPTTKFGWEDPQAFTKLLILSVCALLDDQEPFLLFKIIIFENVRIWYFPCRGFLDFAKKGVIHSKCKINGRIFACKLILMRVWGVMVILSFSVSLASTCNSN